MQSLNLTLLLPAGSQTAVGRLPALETLLARADRESEPAPEPDARLLRLCGIDTTTGLPVAPYCCLADGGVPGERYWLRADPVQLRADQARVYMSADAAALAVTPEEAQQLAAEINELYAVDGWVLQPLHPQRWYLGLPQAPRITTTPPAAVIGGDIHPWLPRGADAIHWHRVMNEIQMVLHGCEVNRRRREQGLPEVNSLWFWGGGALPPVRALPWQRLYAEGCLARGIARQHGIDGGAPPATVAALLQEDGDLLVAWDAVDFDWAAAEQGWFAPLLQALRRGVVTQVELHIGATVYRLNRATLRRFWRRRRPAAGYLGEAVT